MASVVQAVFEDETAAEEAHQALTRDQSHRTVVVLGRRLPDGNELPEGATEFGRNILIACAAGGVFFMVAGGVAGAMDLVLGMNTALGIGLGLVTGLLVGMVGAIQAGTRTARSQLRQSAASLEGGQKIVLAEVDSNRECKEVAALLEQQGGTEVHWY
jgi:hypothetical protein